MNLLSDFVQDSSITKLELCNHRLDQYHGLHKHNMLEGFLSKSDLKILFCALLSESKTINNKTQNGWVMSSSIDVNEIFLVRFFIVAWMSSVLQRAGPKDFQHCLIEKVWCCHQNCICICIYIYLYLNICIHIFSICI